jgi:DNA-binding NarL/FixJ family response regulator
MTPPESILIVDDHPMMRDAVLAMLQDIAPYAQPIQAGSLAQALDELARRHVDLVVLDLSLEDTVGFSGLEAVRARFPEIPVVVHSGNNDSRTVLRAIDVGACGFIPKTFGSDDFRQAFRSILSGNVYVPPIVFGEAPAAGRGLLVPARSVEALDLSPRQVEILGLLITGLSNKLICRRLGIAEGTVKVHVSAILSKLGARNRTEVLLMVSQIGWPQIAQRYGRSGRPAIDPAPRTAPPGAAAAA